MPKKKVTFQMVLSKADEIWKTGEKPTLEKLASAIGVNLTHPDLKLYLDRWVKNLVNKSTRTVAAFEGVRELDERIGQLSEKTDELEKALSLERSILDSTSDAILVVTTDNRFVEANTKFLDMWNIPIECLESGDEQETHQRFAFQVKDPDTLFKESSAFYDDPESSGMLSDIEFKESGCIVETHTQPHRMGDKTVGRVWTFRDVTKRKQYEKSLRLRQRAVDASMNGVVITDMSKKEEPIIFVNPAFEKITGYTKEELYGKSCNFLQKGDINQVGVAKLRLAIKEQREERVVIRNYRKDGELFWNELLISPVPNEKGEVSHYVGVVTDVTQRKKMEEQLYHQATYDKLTDLPNRSLLFDRIKQSIIRANRHDQKVALIFIDLDHFKLVNDTAGHIMGDKLLIKVAEKLKHCIRESDTLARMGGDEFIVVLGEVVEEENILELAEKLRLILEQPFKLGSQEFRVTGSMGISIYPQDGKDATSLIKAADISMYQAKEQGRNTIRVFDKEMINKISIRLDLERKLRQGLEKNEFMLFYQPLIDIKTKTIIGSEALLRWEHPEIGTISPIKFIPIAEESGLILLLGEWVINTACKQLKAWHDQGFDHLKMAVNMSGRQLSEEDIGATVETALKQTCLSATFLDIELTESVLLENPESAVEKLAILKQLGVNLSIDDFGTGYSSLSYLKRFPIDKLKIDREFVRDLMLDETEQGIVKAIITLGQTLGMEVLAEGVETKEQFAFLKAVGCNQIQGYLFSKPVCPAEFEKLLQE